MYSVSSFWGLVSSKRRLHSPPYFFARPKSMAMALAWPMCRYPLGSGGNRVCSRPPFLPAARSSITFCSTKLTDFFSSLSFILFSSILCAFFYIQTAKLQRKKQIPTQKPKKSFKFPPLYSDQSGSLLRPTVGFTRTKLRVCEEYGCYMSANKGGGRTLQCCMLHVAFS